MISQSYKVVTLEIRDGEVNDAHTIASIDIPQGASVREIWAQLVDEEIAQGAFEKGVYDWLDDGFLEIRERSSGKPVFHLIRE